MKKLSYAFALFLAAIVAAACTPRKNKLDINTLPTEIYSGEQGPTHVQGIAVDIRNRAVYYSFTTTLIKTSFEGELLASVEGITGHLGDMTFDSGMGRIYASLEYKHDAIGKGIAAATGAHNDAQDGFYVAMFDTKKIDRIGLQAADVMRTVFLREPTDDYNALIISNCNKEDQTGDDSGKEAAAKGADASKGSCTHAADTLLHRYGCSGIDGISLAPLPGAGNGSLGKAEGSKRTKGRKGMHGTKDGQHLYVAYGIYGDTTRNDNDCQVILRYDVSKWDALAQPLTPDNLHHSGPQSADAQYFVFTGNTTYGVQNMEYDPATERMYMAVYRGWKEQYPNFKTFAIDWTRPVHRGVPQGLDHEADMLSLADAGEHEVGTGLRGWYFDQGTTGFAPIGEGHYYISHSGSVKDNLGARHEYSKVKLYRLAEDSGKLFEEILGFSNDK